jgi:hypothetical protein
MTIEQLFSEPLTFVYSEVDGIGCTYTFTLKEIKHVVKAHNEDYGTRYQTINEFNDGENYRKIEIQLK